MRRLFLLLIAYIVFTSIYSIDFYYSHGQEIQTSERESGQQLYYHTETEDLVFYGTHKWAVKFIVNELVKLANPDTFIVEAVKIYMPSATSGVNIFLQDNHDCEAANCPEYDCRYKGNPIGDFLFRQLNTNLIAGWNSITITPPVKVVNAWLIIEAVNVSNHIDVSASFGDGLASYYWDSFNASSGMFRNFGHNGFGAELLFSLVGSFSHPVMMIDILDVLHLYSIDYDEPFNLSINVKNNSHTTARDVYAKIRVTNGVSTENDSIYLATQLDANEILPKSFYIQLPDSTYSQYELTIQTGCKSDEFAVLGKSKITHAFVYPLKKEKTIIELFAYTGSDNSNTVINTIPSHIDTEYTDIIYYFPNTLDPLYTLESMQRSRKYLLAGNEHVIFNGMNKISNFDDSAFNNKFAFNYNLSQIERTFIQKEDFLAWQSEDNTDLVIVVSFKNINTFIMNPSQNIMSLHLALAQPTQYTSYGNIISIPNRITHFITPAQTGIDIRSLSTPNGTDEQSFFVPIYTIDILPQNSLSDFNVICWIQDNQNRIHLYDSLALKDIDITEEPPPPNNLPQPQIVLYPNPINSSDELKIDFLNSKDQKDINVSIYNIKGQKLVTQKLTSNSLPINSFNLKASGVYFMKIDWIDDGKGHSKIRKLMIVK